MSELQAPAAGARVLRGVCSASLVLAPFAMMSWFQLCPQAGNPACPDLRDPLAAVAAFGAMSSLQQHLFLWAGVAASYLAPVSFLGLGWLALGRAPRLALLGIACGWVGSVPWGYFADSMFYFAAASRLHEGASFARLHSWTGAFAFPPLQVVAGGWVLGHLAGYLVLGIALLRARAIPRWAAWAMMAAAPVMGPLAYGLKIGLLQVGGYLLVLVGSLPAALSTVRGERAASVSAT